MKTPREILLARHQAANPKLDKMRRAVVADLTSRPARAGETLALLLLKLWRELIWPCRRTWVGLAAVWIAIIAFNLSDAGPGPAVVAKSATPPAEMRVAFQEQLRLLEEIIGRVPQATPAEPPRRPNNQPRSELHSVAVA